MQACEERWQDAPKPILLPLRSEWVMIRVQVIWQTVLLGIPDAARPIDWRRNSKSRRLHARGCQYHSRAAKGHCGEILLPL